MPERFIAPVTFQGRHATLEPLAAEHLDAIRAAAADGELWRLWYTSVPAPEREADWLAAALEMRQKQGAMPFAVRDTRDYERLLREQLYRIPGIRHSKSCFVLRRLKETMLPLTGPAT